MANQWLPVNLKIGGKTCAVFGGGTVAERRVDKLLEAGARIKVVSPSVTQRLRDLTEAGSVEHAARKYETADLQEVFLAVAATDDRATNAHIVREAVARGILANSVDGSDDGGNVSMPAVLRQGRLSLGLSTAGTGPALAARLLAELEAWLGEYSADWLEFYAAARLSARRIVKDRKQRERILRELAELAVAGIKAGQEKPAMLERRVVEWLRACEFGGMTMDEALAAMPRADTTGSQE